MKNQTNTITEREVAIIRDILVRVGESEHISQRTLAKELGIALGMTNAYVKRCVRKGLVKVSQAPPNRYLYYLTPEGFSEKSRLTAQYLSDSLTFFRRARVQYAEVFDYCTERGWSRLYFAGVSELGEIAILYARDRGFTLMGVIDQAEQGTAFMDLPVVARAEKPFDAIVVTSVDNPQRAYDKAVRAAGEARALAPRLLRIVHATVPPTGSTEDVPAAAGDDQ